MSRYLDLIRSHRNERNEENEESPVKEGDNSLHSFLSYRDEAKAPDQTPVYTEEKAVTGEAASSVGLLSSALCSRCRQVPPAGHPVYCTACRAELLDRLERRDFVHKWRNNP